MTLDELISVLTEIRDETGGDMKVKVVRTIIAQASDEAFLDPHDVYVRGGENFIRIEAR